MEDQLYDLHAQICRSLAHPRRLKIIDALREGEKCVNDLVEELGIASRWNICRVELN